MTGVTPATVSESAQRSHERVIANDVDSWRREARLWEARARSNSAVIHAHERTIDRLINRLAATTPQEVVPA